MEGIAHPEDSAGENDLSSTEQGGTIYGGLDMMVGEAVNITPAIADGHAEAS